MRILVTGGLGAIGSWVTRILVEKGFRPVVFDTRPDFSLVSDIADQVDLVLGDLLDLATLIRTVKDRGVEAIAHLGAWMPPAAQENPLMGFKVNAEGTVNILEAARIAGIKRVVFTSSKAVYGDARGVYGHPTYESVPEDHPVRPKSVYGAAKLAGENMGRNYQRNYGLEFVALRLGSTYGPGKGARHGAVAFLPRLIQDVMEGKEVRVLEGGDQKNDFIYNRDVANGVVLACLAEKLEHYTFNIGTGQSVTLDDIAAVLKDHFPKARIEIGPGLDYMGLARSYESACYFIMDISRAQAELGYQPQYDLAGGIRDFIKKI
jgi:UDP-glucose 4-epimerase